MLWKSRCSGATGRQVFVIRHACGVDRHPQAEHLHDQPTHFQSVLISKRTVGSHEVGLRCKVTPENTEFALTIPQRSLLV